MGVSPSIVDVASDFDFAEIPANKKAWNITNPMTGGLLEGRFISNAVYAFMILPGSLFSDHSSGTIWLASVLMGRDTTD